MKKKYFFLSSAFSYAVSVLIFIILLAGIIVNCFLFIRNHDLSQSEKALNLVSSIVMGMLIVCLGLLTFNAHYTLTTRKLSVCFGMFWRSVDYEDVVLIRSSAVKKQILLYYRCYSKDGTEKINYFNIRIQPKYYKDFIDSIRSYRSEIVSEDFDATNEE